jgi:hypothetical protein
MQQPDCESSCAALAVCGAGEAWRDQSVYATGVQAVEIHRGLVPLYDIEWQRSRAAGNQGRAPCTIGTEIEYSTTGDRVNFTVPKLLCHQIVELVS